MAARASLGKIGHGAAPDGRPEGVMEKVPLSTDIAIGLTAAVIASGSVVPIILTIDKAVVMNAAGTCSLTEAITTGVKDLVRHPGAMIRSVPLWLVWGVYGATYSTANMIDLYVERKEITPTNASMGKLVGTTAVNMSASLVKDVVFAKLFGAPAKDVGKAVKDAAAKAPKRVPPATYGLFLTRDTLTIAGGFTVPPLVSSALQSGSGMEKPAADKVAQLISPMGMQLICTPLHLLALNMYNVPDASLSQRVADVWKTCPQATFVRMFRFLGAYGIGGLTNKAIIRSGKDWTVDAYSTPEIIYCGIDESK